MDPASYDIERLALSRLGDSPVAGLWIASVPWPRKAAAPLCLGGAPTSILPLGRWPGGEGPRRLLLIGDGENRAPEQLRLGYATGGKAEAPRPPTATMVLRDACKDDRFAWESHSLQITYQGRSVEISLGIRKRSGEILWWENCGVVQKETGPHFSSIEMGGVIPLTNESFDELTRHPGYTNPLLHKHHWLNGHLAMRLHSNGVCEVWLRHVNSRFVDGGGDLEDAVPVVGLRVEASEEELRGILGEWDGACSEFALGGVAFDLSEPARLLLGELPGRFDREADGRIVWQPFAGMNVFGGDCPSEILGDPFIVRPEQRRIPQGMARTLRFTLSLSERSPKVATYLAPAWWYGVCEDFLPEPLLPVENEYHYKVEEARAWIRKCSYEGGFEDGAVVRNDLKPREIGRRTYYEPGWEGDTPYTQFLSAWRTGDAEEYFAALRSAYHFVDIAVDHAAKLVRMHGFAGGKLSQPSCRMMGALAAYLETGDAFLLGIAEAVTLNAYWTHKNSWPRMAVGRDACYLRSAVLLYRYFGNDYFREVALDGALDTLNSQRPNGSFGDQGGGARLHGWNAYIVKPWMGTLALNGILDYLELFPHERKLREGVLRFADWLLAERAPFENRHSWYYQHEFNGQRRIYDFYQTRWFELPAGGNWHHETLARLLTYASITTGDSRYFEAWAESAPHAPELVLDQAANAVLQFIPWVQAKLWNARLTEGGFSVEPLDLGPSTPREARVYTPEGVIPVVRSGDSAPPLDAELPPPALARAARAGASGFSLIEVTLAIGILGFCMVSIMGLLSVALKFSRQSIDRNLETRMLQNIRAELGQVPYSLLPAEGSYFFDAEAYRLASDAGEDRKAYEATYQTVSEATLPSGQTNGRVSTCKIRIVNLLRPGAASHAIILPDNGF